MLVLLSQFHHLADRLRIDLISPRPKPDPLSAAFEPSDATPELPHGRDEPRHADGGAAGAMLLPALALTLALHRSSETIVAAPLDCAADAAMHVTMMLGPAASVHESAAPEAGNGAIRRLLLTTGALPSTVQ